MFRIPSVLSPLSRIVARPNHQYRMQDECCKIGRRSYGYGLIESNGPTVVLIHGWALAHSAYRSAAETIAAQGYRVVVPDLPGFGSSSDLPLVGLSLGSYARAMQRFLEHCPDVGGEPVHLVGHSFGGAVAAQLASDAPELVRSVVLVSSVSGATWRRDEDEMEHLLTERPLWDWGYHLISEFPLSRFPQAGIDVLRDLSHNLIWHLPNMGLVAHMIRRTDLRGELAKVSEQRIPVAVLWAAGDRVVTRACFDDQCKALGVDGRVVEGNHGWPLADPTSFGQTVADTLRSLDRPEATCPNS